MSEKPTAAFVLSLIAGILVLLNGVIVAVEERFVALLPQLGIVELLISLPIVNIVLGVLIIVGAVLINSGEPGKVKKGSILVFVLSIISLFTGGGFAIGFILGILGGIFGYEWILSH